MKQEEENHLKILNGMILKNNMKNKLIWISLILIGCQTLTEKKVKQTEQAIISTDYLNELMGNHQPDLVIIDFREEEMYFEGHIPGALNSWRGKIQNETNDFSGMIASKSQIENELSNLGISPSNKIVVYDDNGDVNAARLWWVLSYYGHKDVMLLDGGYTSWKLEGFDVTIKAPAIRTSEYKFHGSIENTLYANMNDIESAINNKNVIILDVRSLGEYSEVGHIPGAIHWDWANNINYEGDKKFKDIESLRVQFEKLGINKNEKVIAYCASGVRAAHTTFVLKELLGIENVKNYDGSWNEWVYQKKEFNLGMNP